ncbi:hypothetical protein FHP25_28275 [Vineibacter terrae]|uniref:ARG and Rhodanese-Phosphatase-superfamily-associated domain-containing protein n=1 Tax=Vineibacter terrae TaxID=2586908 RepID=A0A5C8PF47_9HYPH|nr:DUF6569 family protein [Vineibacter terrae]TXL71770.1 hypothetical protein FHP25_28275 [Vineibacter terrae]
MTQRDLASFLTTLSFGSAQICRNLTLLPILSSERGPSGLLTLDEALSRSLVEVTEVSEEGDVPRLLFLNHGTDPVLLIDGEELVGARQNRILNLSVLAPGHQSLEIPVSCVEQGRWAWKSRRFTTSDRVIYAKLRRANVESVSASLRRSGRRSTDQYQVWSDVSAKSARLDASSETWAAGALYERHAADIEGFVNSFATTERQVGAAFLVDGRLAGLEVFGSTDLLSHLFPKIVRGYALDALDREEPGGASDVALEPTEGLAALARSQATRHRAVGLGEDLRLTAPGLVGAGLIAGGKVIHLTAYPNVSV